MNIIFDLFDQLKKIYFIIYEFFLYVNFIVHRIRIYNHKHNFNTSYTKLQIALHTALTVRFIEIKLVLKEKMVIYKKQPILFIN